MSNFFLVNLKPICFILYLLFNLHLNLYNKFNLSYIPLLNSNLLNLNINPLIFIIHLVTNISFIKNLKNHLFLLNFFITFQNTILYQFTL